MNRQLQKIINQFGTNEQLRNNLPGKELNSFVANVNHLISLFKKEEQHTIRQNIEFRQEITNVSHDIRTPLTSIKGFSELLLDPQLSSSERNEYLKIIQKKTDTLLRTVNTFYEISQLESGDTVLCFETFSLGELVVETILTFQADFEKKEINVKIKEDNFAKMILANKKATERIILNIIQNALRYSHNFFEISIQENERSLVLEAKNDGQSISSAELSKIFDRSYTIDQSRRDGQTGLGLYIVKAIAEKQGGATQATFENGIFSLAIYFQKSQ
ncbi:sensor histidine kinase [Enterococcus gallinarum]|uniref:sensor histidine kinase n=1 Tax=Enterococcus gallinarum TaxID=1353 RepID=UPI001177D30C|nr:HAMP domain-containing sensor histidine kinase [Enterococcus gallinarum]MDT2684739.1 HAMP domain-containing sensor histidine kinase [Enterococcus gallinarum]